MQDYPGAASWIPLRWRLAVLLLGVLLVACAGPAAVQPPPTRSPIPPASPVVSPAPATSPVQSPPIAAGDRLAIPAGGAVRFVLTPGQSKVNYRGHEQLRALTIPSEAVGSTQDVTGSLVLEERGTIRQADSHLTVDLRSLVSDQPIRDNYIQENTIQSSRFPTADFQPKEIRGLPNPIPLGTDVPIELLGDLTVHGTTRPVTWTGSARLDGDTLTGTMSTNVTITEFGMELPRVFLVLSLEDALTLEIAFQARSELLPRP